MSRNTDPTVRIVLEDGTGTWVTVVPVQGWTAHDVWRAMREAEQHFQESIFSSEAAVEQQLRKAIAKGIE
jgi:hypothetical protein